jgi:hypothetical protein
MEFSEAKQKSMTLKLHSKLLFHPPAPLQIPVWDEDELAPDEVPSKDDVAILACQTPWEMKDDSKSSVNEVFD